jgi:hypothetical protein
VVLLAVCAAALGVGSAGAAAPALVVGVNESLDFEAANSSWFTSTMNSEGLATDTITLLWDETAPTPIEADVAAQIGSVVAAAQAAGVTVELDLYPLHSQALTNGLSCPPNYGPTGCGNSTLISQFAAWTAQVAQAFPTVHTFIVMNECNQPLFINPQWDTAGVNQSAEICGRALAAAYDALKAADAANFVWGLGLSPRGNDAPNAPSNSSTSPVHFLADLGAWFRAFVKQTHRSAPLMDGLDFHPYPVPQSLPFAQGYADSNDATVSNLPRIYQAFYSAFAGTPQPTIGQQHGGGLPVSLNEVGIQTAESGQPGYVGTEVSATPSGGVIGPFATESYQSTWYREMLDYVACDPNVRVVNIFHLVDDTDLAGWQSGLYTAATPPQPKQSAQTVAAWLATTKGRCAGQPRPWMPSSGAARPKVTTAGQTGVFFRRGARYHFRVHGPTVTVKSSALLVPCQVTANLEQASAAGGPANTAPPRSAILATTTLAFTQRETLTLSLQLPNGAPPGPYVVVVKLKETSTGANANITSPPIALPAAAALPRR